MFVCNNIFVFLECYFLELFLNTKEILWYLYSLSADAVFFLLRLYSCYQLQQPAVM